MAIEISASGNGVVESSANSVRFTITLSEPSADVVTIRYRTLLAGTAGEDDLWYASTSTANNTYRNGSGPLLNLITFQPGETTAEVLVRTTGDTLDEYDEHTVLELYDPSHGVFAGGAATLRTTGVILDNDGPGSNLAYFVSDPVIVEGDGGAKLAVFEVRLSQPAPSGFNFSYTTIDGTAKAGSDYVAKTGTLGFVPGQETATVTVQIKGDILSEASEAFFLSVQPLPGAPVLGRNGAVGTATLLDDDSGMGPVVSLSAGTAVVESSAHSMRFTVTLSEVANDAVTVNFRTLLAGTAGEDDLWYTSTSTTNNGVMTFAPGETSKDIFVLTTGDTTDERDEHIVVELFDPKGAGLEGGAPALRQSGIILDADGVGSNLSMFVSDPVLLEGNSGSRNAVFEVRLSRPAPQALAATYRTVDGTAVAGSDYAAATGSIGFVAGQDAAYITVPVIGGTLAEITETFSLVVTAPANPSIGTDGAVGTATILDDEPGAAPVINLSGGEGVVERSSNYIRFVVTLSKPSLEAVTVKFNTQLGTASNADLWYSSTSPSNNGMVTFAPGETSKSVFILTTGDSLDERDETLSLVLSNPTNAVLAGGRTSLRETGFILDDPGDGVGLNIALAGTNAVITESAAVQRLEVVVELSRPASTATTFNVSTSNQTAAGADFQLVDRTVTFAPGQTLATVTVNVLADRASEGDETFALNFSLAAGAYPAGVIPSTIVTIKPGPIFGTAAGETINGGIHADTIYGLDGNDRLNGLGGNDTLSGGNGNDILAGGVGADRLVGGTGNDTYVADAADTISEAANAGIDVVQSSASRALGANLENLVLLGTAAINGTGNALANRLTGNAGNNVLTGGPGADILAGGLGNDTYHLENGADTVSDAGGIDTITSTVNRSLASYPAIENLSLPGAAAISGTGNALANVLRGNNAANTLSGGAGSDTLVGNGGNDVLYGGAGNDLMAGGAGADSFVFNTALNPSANVDRITDFYVPQDTIRLDNAVMPGLGAKIGTLSTASFWKSTAGVGHDASDRIIYDIDSGRLFYDANGNAAGGAVHFATLAPNLALTNADFVVI